MGPHHTVSADVAGGLVFITAVLLGAYFQFPVPVLQAGMYGICLVAVLPHIGPFADSLQRQPANLLLVLLFTALTTSTLAAFARVPSSEAMLQAKALAATALWASIYIVVFSSVRTTSGVHRFVQWITFAGLVITASVYLSALGHAIGFRFGEVLAFRDGTARVFGPLGDQVGFILVLPALMRLVAARPLMFSVHVGALLLTATRGAVLCLVLGVLAYCLMVALGRIRLDRKQIVRIAVTAAALCIVGLTPASSVLMGRMLESPLEGGYSYRLTAIETGATIFRDNLLLGVGFNGFANSRPAVAEDWVNPQTAENGLSRAANQYVQTATDGGVPSLVLLLLFVLFSSRNALRVTKWRQATPQLVGMQLWLIAVLAGNLGALWFLSNAASGFFIFAAAGLAARVSAEVPRHDLAPSRS